MAYGSAAGWALRWSALWRAQGRPPEAGLDSVLRREGGLGSPSRFLLRCCPTSWEAAAWALRGRAVLGRRLLSPILPPKGRSGGLAPPLGGSIRSECLTTKRLSAEAALVALR
jgi:hypothetical protein